MANVPGIRIDIGLHREQQRELALKELEYIQATGRDLRKRQFSILGSSVALMVALTTVSVSLSQHFHSSKLVLLPLFYAVLVLLTWVLFLQLQSQIIKRAAFSLLLQTGLAAATLPRCYRGWDDAYANYVQFTKRGATRSSGIGHVMMPDRPIQGEFRVLWRALPPVIFQLVAAGFFAAAFLGSLSMSAALVLFDDMGRVTSAMLFVLLVVAALVVMFGFWRVSNRLWRGDMSLRYLLQVFQQILDRAAPYDATYDGPIRDGVVRAPAGSESRSARPDR